MILNSDPNSCSCVLKLGVCYHHLLYVMLGIELWTLFMLGKHSNNRPHAYSLIFFVDFLTLIIYLKMKISVNSKYHSIRKNNIIDLSRYLACSLLKNSQDITLLDSTTYKQAFPVVPQED